MHSIGKPQTSNPLTSLLRIPLQADLQPARPRYARSISFLSVTLALFCSGRRSTYTAKVNTFCPKIKKTKFCFYHSTQLKLGFQVPASFFFYNVTSSKWRKSHKSSDFWLFFCCTHGGKKHSQSQTENIPANTPPGDAKLFKIDDKPCLFFSSWNWATPCNANLSLWEKSTVVDKLLPKNKNKVTSYVKYVDYLCWWQLLITKSQNNTSSYQEFVVYIINVLFHEWSSCFYDLWWINSFEQLLSV